MEIGFQTVGGKIDNNIIKWINEIKNHLKKLLKHESSKKENNKLEYL